MESKYYYSKYLQYKKEYFNIKNQRGGNGSNKLCFDLAKKINGVFSPLSITFALSILHLGAYGNTDKQLTELFNNKYTINELNNIYTLFNNDIMKVTNVLILNNKYKVNNQYLDLIKNLSLIEYRSFNDINFIVKRVNNYIETNTKGLIKDTISNRDIDLSTIMILINTIYFKANWMNEFNPNKTHKSTFRGLDKKINMMTQTNNFNYHENNDLQIIEIPYKQNDYTMGIILPKGDEIPIISNNKFISLIDNLKTERIELYLPKFTHRKNIQLVPILQNLGITDLFNSNANLNISDKAYVSKIIHESVVIVDEKGTEAAAVTVVIMKSMAVMPLYIKPIIFRADHEFIYYIRHIPTNTLLFYGNFNG
ncbi:serpin [Indivirus ILV1]|uniref:Serpin n=1 Tax=Indivirus ILV1 TaxID=1977633 RepID=A0A1V0SEB4_9VIRU|nr:serpin [Indivirus ILV1]